MPQSLHISFERCKNSKWSDTLLSFLPSIQPCSPRIRRSPLPRHLELDERMARLCSKIAHDSWMWIAPCRKTRQGVASAVGDRSKKTCQRVWEAIPDSYRTGHCFTDFWAASQAVIPQEQHPAAGKETGETAHVERWNNTALAASGSFCPHDVVLFQVRAHVRGLLSALSPSLQSGPGYPSQMSH
jgi:IS1 family transposase